MSAPMVAGAVALLLQDEPDLNPDQVKYRLMATGTPIQGSDGDPNSYPYLDVYAAVTGTTTDLHSGSFGGAVVNPATGETITIKAKKYVHFKPGKTLRERVEK